MKLKILEEATKDIINGYKFYETQKTGLGEYFIDSIFSNIEPLKILGSIHQKFFGFHRMISKRFPYAIYYKKDNETIIVYAVLDCRQNPNGIKLKLQERE